VVFFIGVYGDNGLLGGWVDKRETQQVGAILGLVGELV
jgi:hypothetical protein